MRYAVGSAQLAVRSWQYAVYSSQLAVACTLLLLAMVRQAHHDNPRVRKKRKDRIAALSIFIKKSHKSTLYLLILLLVSCFLLLASCLFGKPLPRNSHSPLLPDNRYAHLARIGHFGFDFGSKTYSEGIGLCI